MKVMVSCCGRFSGHQAAIQLHKRDLLQLYFTTYDEPRVPPEKTYRIPLLDLASKALRRLPVLGRRIPFNDARLWLFDTLAQRHVAGADIIHFFSAEQPKTIRRAKQLGLPTIMNWGTAHPVYQKQILTEEFARFAPDFSFVYPPKIKKLREEFESLDRISVVSTYVYDTFIEQGFPPEKLIVANLGVDLSLFYPVEKKDDTFRILTVGLPSLQKGTHYLLQAFSELQWPEAELQIVGRPRPEMGPIMAKYEGEFTHIPGVPHAELYRTYSNASVFVLPSINDGFPAVVMEAMACGIPVIISQNVGSRDAVREGVEGFVIPIRDVTALKDRLTQLREEPDLARKMGRAALQRAKEFSWERYGDRIVPEYRRLLDHPARG